MVHTVIYINDYYYDDDNSGFYDTYYDREEKLNNIKSLLSISGTESYYKYV